jgi:hypothetical protein
MTDAATATGANRLPVIASSIRDHLEAAEQATRRGLEHAIAAGVLLIEAKTLLIEANKALVVGDKWLDWIEKNCRVRARQAQSYMRLARHCHRLEALKTSPDSFLTIAAAVALIGRPRPERPRGLPGQLDLLGGPEVPPPSPTVPAAFPVADRALFDLINDLEQGLAVIRSEAAHLGANRRRQGQAAGLRERRAAALRAAASAIATTIAYLRERLR